MSGSSASTNPNTTKQTTDDTSKTTSTASEGSNKKAPAVQEEDDEFEDFPVDDWPDHETEAANANAGPDGSSAHLWEESWDDDDKDEDFAVMLREEMKKVQDGKR